MVTNWSCRSKQLREEECYFDVVDEFLAVRMWHYYVSLEIDSENLDEEKKKEMFFSKNIDLDLDCKILLSLEGMSFYSIRSNSPEEMNENDIYVLLIWA